MHRAIKHAMAVTVTLAVAVSANADLIGLVQELVDPVAQGWTRLGYDDEALVTYRIYAWFDSDEASVTVVGDVGGDDRELSLGPGPFFNSALGSDFAPNPNFTGVAPDTLWDTFVTIGEEVAQGASGLPNTSGAPGFPQQAGGLTGCVTLDDTGWFVSSFPSHANAVDGRVLLAQLTVPALTQVWGADWRISGVDNGVPFDAFVSFGWPGFCPECPADLDGDDQVGFDDLTQLLGAWGLCDGCAEDLDGDASVGFDDLTMLLGAWGACP